MWIYEKAYECYREACQKFGMDYMNMKQFLENVTKEQLHEYVKQAIN